MESLPNDFDSNLALSDTFSDFLDQYFYKPMESLIIEKDPRVANIFFERVYDKERQRRGFDVIMHEGAWSMSIDENAQLSKMNNPLNTFCLELSYLKNGEAMPGWLLDNSKQTTAYMLCWPKGPENTTGVFTGADMMLIFSARIKKFLEYKGYTHEVLCQREGLMRADGLPGRRNSGCPDFWFVLSKQLKEQPIGKSLISGTWLGQELNASSVA